MARQEEVGQEGKEDEVEAGAKGQGRQEAGGDVQADEHQDQGHDLRRQEETESDRMNAEEEGSSTVLFARQAVRSTSRSASVALPSAALNGVHRYTDGQVVSQPPDGVQPSVPGRSFPLIQHPCTAVVNTADLQIALFTLGTSSLFSTAPVHRPQQVPGQSMESSRLSRQITRRPPYFNRKENNRRQQTLAPERRHWMAMLSPHRRAALCGRGRAMDRRDLRTYKESCVAAETSGTSR